VDDRNGKVIAWVWRIFFYVVSLLTLALGIILTTKAGLGVSPIVSVSYSVSSVFGWNFGNTTLGLYTLFVVVEFILKGKNAKAYDVLQVPLSIVFTRFINIFNDHIIINFEKLWENILLLVVAIILTGIGAAMSVNMKLVPNPGDGIVAAIADKIHKPMGFTKNCFDLLNITITFCVGIVSGHFLLGIGIGTVMAVIGVGRSVAAFNYICKKPMAKLCGIENL
jgi:uncharacterized membrane protein YczE